MKTNEHLNALSLRLASPDIIRSWSRGEIQKPETINYRTGRSERGGLFDERIFGPEKDFQCYCGKYKGIRYKGIICEKCGVEITRSIVRRERMGHIELASPVAHIWMLRGIPSRMSMLLDVSVTQLEKVIYFAGYIVTHVDEGERIKILKELEVEYKSKLKTLIDENEQEKFKTLYQKTRNEITNIRVHKVLNEIEYNSFSMKYSTLFEAGIGAESVHHIFKSMNLEQVQAELEHELEKTEKATRDKIEKRLILVRSMLRSGVRPEWMFLTVIPIIPPALRPMVALEGGRHATSDVNDLYRRVINRNNRLKKLKEIGAPDVILRNEKRILQEAVDSLIDNTIRKTSGSAAMSQAQRRQLKSLADNLKGKQGLFRSNLLGKRVDYSGRSVIVVGPNLKLNECGLPKYMALELFKPFVMSEIIKRELAFNIRGAGKLVEDTDPIVWEILEEVIKGKYVLLNRAPTLHRLSIQAFNPVLIEGKAIQIHPLVCSAFNADFDGDQMAVHVPLSDQAQREARELIAANKNLLRPQTGEPVTTPSQDIVLGCYWMTSVVEGSLGEGRIFGSVNEAITSYDFGMINFRAKIMVRGSNTPKYFAFKGELFPTTVGRLLFNSIFPDDFPFVDGSVTKKILNKTIQKVINQYGIDATPPMLDRIKAFGNQYATLSGTTFGIDEPTVPKEKKALVIDAKKRVDIINDQFSEGLISDQERYRMTIEVWSDITRKIQSILEKEVPNIQSINDMLVSGARGTLSQLNQSSGMKGVIVNAKGQELDFPIISSYKEGLTPLEYFINTTTARKGLTDTALNTAKAGYLTRRLHDVAQDVVIMSEDCGTKDGILISSQNVDGIERSLSDLIYGRVVSEDIVDNSKNVIAKRNTLITKELASEIETSGIKSCSVRSPLTCSMFHGLCRHCYGMDLGRNGLVRLGEAVGTVASQAIGEPGTQLTLRTFHSGGVTGRDITQGLPRVEEIFERRIPKVPAVIAHDNGMITDLKKVDGKFVITLTADASGKSASSSKSVDYVVDARRVPIIKKGQEVTAGQTLTDGSIDTLELFRVAGKKITESYIVNEVAKVYELHGTPVDRKHLDLIIRQMFSRRKVTEPGDSLFSTGEIVENSVLAENNTRLEKEGKLSAKAEIMLMGISDVALSTTSWLSSASFQHTNRVLITAAIQGRVDTLRGLKENVIIGGLIPAGTGFDANFVDMTGIRTTTAESSDVIE